MKILQIQSIIISIFAFTLLLTGVFGLPSNNASSVSYSSPVKWIYDYAASGLIVTDLNITKSDSEIVVKGTLHNKDHDNTKLTAGLKLHLYSKTSELLDTLLVDPKQILKPHEKVDFVARYASPEVASNLHHIYALFYSDNCGVVNVNNMGCFGQGINATKIDPRTKLPIK